MISISAYGAKAKTDSTKISTGGASSSSSGGSFTPVNLWGQYFDDTQDIDGDMTVNGTIRADRIVTQNMDAGNMSVDNLDVNERLTAQAALVQDLEADALKADRAELANALINELAAGNLVTNNLTVTQGAYFFELVIDKIKSAGGAIILSPADGFKIDKVVDVDSTHKRLYFRSEDGSKKIHNMWQTGDQAISQNFNNAKVGKSYNVSSKFWWALVTDTNNDSNNGEPVSVNFGTQDSPDNKLCHYITVSTEQNEFIGDVSPEVDEDVAMLGSRVEGRQSAQYLAAYASLDIDLKAPLFAQYQGINDFDLASHKITWFSSGVTAAGEVKGLLQNEITGSFRTSSGKTMEDLIEEAAQGTTYRLIVNPAAIKVDTNGTVTPSTLTMTILESSAGEVTEYNTVPNFLKVELYGVSGSNESKIFTRDSSNSSLSFSTANLYSFDYCYAKLLSSTTLTTYDKVSIAKNTDASVTIEGDVTEIDKLIDNGSLAKIGYVQGSTGLQVVFNINMSVYHFEAGNSFQLNPSTIPPISNYSVNWEWNKKNTSVANSSNGTISAPPSGSNFTFQATIPYSTDTDSNDCKSYLKVTLLKNGNVVDSMIVHVTMKAEAILEVVQGEIPYIRSTVQATIEESFEEWSNSMSEITQFADSITSRVQTLENSMEGVTGSYESIISQTASEILAQVSDGLSNTGIDIINHIINLNADNTNINGSLNIYGAYGTGFKVWNDVQGSATKSVQIANISLGQVQNYLTTSINSGLESINIIGMDGAAFMSDYGYSRFMWWGKSTADDKYEFIVRNRRSNLRVKEEGIFRTTGWSTNVGGMNPDNTFGNAGIKILNTDVGQEYNWADISSTSPVYMFQGDLDLVSTTGDPNDTPHDATWYPDATLRRCGIFVCKIGQNNGDTRVYLPNPNSCIGRKLIFKSLCGVDLILTTHGNDDQFIMRSEDSNTYNALNIGTKTVSVIAVWNNWIVLQGV